MQYSSLASITTSFLYTKYVHKKHNEKSSSILVYKLKKFIFNKKCKFFIYHQHPNFFLNPQHSNFANNRQCIKKRKKKKMQKIYTKTFPIEKSLKLSTDFRGNENKSK